MTALFSDISGRQIVVESIAEELVKLKCHRRYKRLFVVGGGEVESMILSEGSQASPTSPSAKGRMKVKRLGWLETLA
jgi:hypothetical protein